MDNEQDLTYSLTELLHGVFDQGVRDWISLKYSQFFEDGPEGRKAEFAYRCTYQAADLIFGAETWKAKVAK